MTLSIFFSFFGRDRTSLAARNSATRMNAVSQNADAATPHAHDWRVSQQLCNASDLAALETRMRSLESERGWW